MNVLASILMAFACFSAIPMPSVEWDERNMRYMMAALPLIGLIIGLCVWLWHLTCNMLGIGTLLHAAGLTLLPLVITGGIHMDGLADVIDAQSSHADAARKRQILKDPHVGAFAIIGVCSYLLAYCALASELPHELVPILCLIPIGSRCVGGLSVVSAQPANDKGMLATMKATASTTIVRVVLLTMLVATTEASCLANPLAGGVAVALALLALVYILRLAHRDFGGMSGDLVGCYIQIAELSMLAGVVLVGKLV